MRRLLPFLILAISPALAAEKADDAGTVIKGGPPGTNVGPEGVPYLMAPMTGPDGKLGGYAYVSMRMTTTSGSASVDVRNELAFIQDAWVRDVNGQGVASTADPAKVDIPALEARLLADVSRVMSAAGKGTKSVKMVTVCTVQVADLHPKQTANLAGTADEAALKAIPKSRCEPELAAK